MKFKDSIAHPLYLLWHHMLNMGVMPAQATTTPTPVFKGRSGGLVKNYWPIALTSHMVKIFEKVLRNGIYLYLEERNLLKTNQHGF